MSFDTTKLKPATAEFVKKRLEERVRQGFAEEGDAAMQEESPDNVSEGRIPPPPAGQAEADATAQALGQPHGI